MKKKLTENLFGPGSGRFQKSDPDPVKNRPDPQHWLFDARFFEFRQTQ
jgi:hypothetical protein